jgi:3-oxoacyl-[acyl-carrier protein] reductase
MKNIVIIGGSKGIGFEILKQQLQNGNLVYNISRTIPEITNENLKHFGINILEDILPEIENIDTLLYCPGSINLKPIGSLSIDDFRNDFEINVIGAVKAIQKYLPALKKGNNPSIVLFSTVAVKLGMPFHASIATSKAGIEGLVKSLGAELASVVRVNAIAPTITETSLSANILRNDRMKENMVERHPMKNYLKPEEVANMANFLISENAKSISGQVFEMDYGLVSFKM